MYKKKLDNFGIAPNFTKRILQSICESSIYMSYESKKQIANMQIRWMQSLCMKNADFFGKVKVWRIFMGLKVKQIGRNFVQQLKTKQIFQ